MMNWTSMESQKGVTVVTAWPVNHLQSAFFLCSLLDASRLGPSLWGASKHSEEMKNRVEVRRLMFGNFAECDPLALDNSVLKILTWPRHCGTFLQRMAQRRFVPAWGNKEHSKNMTLHERLVLNLCSVLISYTNTMCVWQERLLWKRKKNGHIKNRIHLNANALHVCPAFMNNDILFKPKY